VAAAVWAVGLILIVVVTAAFYPSFGDLTAESVAGGGDAMNSFLGLNSAIDPGSPLGYLWIGLYANILPWTLMALGISLGTGAIAGDEEVGLIEFLLARPVSRTTVAVSRFLAAVTILFAVAAATALSLIVCLPLFELTDATTTTAADGSTVSVPGATVGDIAAGTLASFAVALGSCGIAYLVGGITGRKNITLTAASAVAIGGYVLYTVSNTTGSLDAISRLTQWHWYVDDVMLIDGLSWNVLWPFLVAASGFLVGWQVFLRRDLHGD
jgi:ABC-2 type transport system permease protein